MTWRRRAWIVAALAALWPPGGTSAVDYEPISLACLAAASDAIVLGKVERDSTGAYWVNVKRVASGERLAGRLRLAISPWQGESPERPSGEALLFLRRAAEDNGLEVVGPSADGWLPVERGAVRIAGIRVSEKTDEPVATAKSPRLAVVLQALRGLGKCVRWDRSVGHGRVRATLLCNQEVLESQQRRSPVERALIAEAKRAATTEGVPCLAIAANPRSHR